MCNSNVYILFIFCTIKKGHAIVEDFGYFYVTRKQWFKNIAGIMKILHICFEIFSFSIFSLHIHAVKFSLNFKYCFTTQILRRIA